MAPRGPPAPAQPTFLPTLQQIPVLIAIAATFAGLVLSYADVRGKAEGAEERARAVEARVERLETRVADKVDNIARNVEYLCNERRRDNQEEGRPVSGQC